MRKIWSMLLSSTVIVGAAATTHADVPFFVDDICDGSWTEYNHDFVGTRTNDHERILSKSTVGGLKIKWQYPAAGPVNGTPIVADGTVYIGDAAGFMYALTTEGQLVWKTQVQSGVTASVTIVGDLLVFGDLAGNLYGMRRKDGSVVWTEKADSHPATAIFGSGLRLGPFVAIGVASEEEQFAADPNYPCCTFKGSVIMLEARTGKFLWKKYLITDAQAAQGASGAAVWCTPTFDPLTGQIFITTGNNYTPPTTVTGDGFVALDAITGNIRWATQLVPNDTWNIRFPYTPGAEVDADFGDSPQVYTLPGGRRVVGAGGKSGFYHVLDLRNGKVINQVQVEPGGTLGGLFADSAYDKGVVFANGINWPGGSPAAGLPPTAGDLIAIAGDGSHELWRFTTPGSPDLAAVAVANGVVYYGSSFAGTLFALDESTGAPLAAVPYGLSVSGPSVVDGQVYAGSGLNFGPVNAPGAITAFGL